jgi:hypothetical protein
MAASERLLNLYTDTAAGLNLRIKISAITTSFANCVLNTVIIVCAVA